jgi:putative oxidoreductase
MRYIVPIGRIMYSLIFIAAILSNFSRGAIAAGAAHGVPLASILVPLSGILAFVGGLSVLFGYKARYGALLLLLFLVPVTLIMHAFWNVTDPMMHMVQHAAFLKNVSMAGAALLIIYFGSGPFSLEH